MQEPQVLQQHFAVALEWCFRGADAADFADWLNAGYPTALTELRQIGSENPPMPWSGKPAAEAIMEIARNNPKVWPLIFSRSRTLRPDSVPLSPAFSRLDTSGGRRRRRRTQKLAPQAPIVRSLPPYAQPRRPKTGRGSRGRNPPAQIYLGGFEH